MATVEEEAGPWWTSGELGGSWHGWVLQMDPPFNRRIPGRVVGVAGYKQSREQSRFLISSWGLWEESLTDAPLSLTSTLMGSIRVTFAAVACLGQRRPIFSSPNSSSTVLGTLTFWVPVEDMQRLDNTARGSLLGLLLW